MDTPETYMFTAVRLDNRNVNGRMPWDDQAQRYVGMQLFRGGHLATIDMSADESDIYISTAIPGEDGQLAVATLAYAVWDAMDTSDTPTFPVSTLRIIEARALEATIGQIEESYTPEIMPFMDNHTPYVESIDEMRGVLGDTVVIGDFF
jgi:hypothetical protein